MQAVTALASLARRTASDSIAQAWCSKGLDNLSNDMKLRQSVFDAGGVVQGVLMLLPTAEGGADGGGDAAGDAGGSTPGGTSSARGGAAGGRRGGGGAVGVASSSNASDSASLGGEVTDATPPPLDALGYNVTVSSVMHVGDEADDTSSVLSDYDLMTEVQSYEVDSLQADLTLIRNSLIAHMVPALYCVPQAIIVLPDFPKFPAVAMAVHSALDVQLSPLWQLDTHLLQRCEWDVIVDTPPDWWYSVSGADTLLRARAADGTPLPSIADMPELPSMVRAPTRWTNMLSKRYLKLPKEDVDAEPA
ncbi:MAG: hypothetical protein EOO41_04030, partial [Methanobacteriota archaeon]